MGLRCVCSGTDAENAYLYQVPYWVSSSSSEGWALVFSLSGLSLFLPTSCIFCLYRRYTCLSHRHCSSPFSPKCCKDHFSRVLWSSFFRLTLTPFTWGLNEQVSLGSGWASLGLNVKQQSVTMHSLNALGYLTHPT